MQRSLFLGVGGLVVLCVAASAFGQTGGPFVEIKSPPLRDSDVWTLPINYHSPGIPNYAGALMKMHILDATEVDVDKIIPTLSATGTVYTDPFGPRSENQQSVPQFFTAWHPNAAQSGTNLPVSQTIQEFDIQLHAKNTNLGENSDVDITAMFWNIRHLQHTTQSSQVFTLQPSDWAYGFPGTDPLLMSEIPTQNPEPGSGVWYHVDPAIYPNGKQFHVQASFPGSFFYATQALAGTTLAIGIEHIPEPVGLGLMLSGIGAAGAAAVCRRRRRKLA